MYYLTTTIDEEGLTDLINETAVKINAPFRKCQPFGIVRTEEPINPETMPAVMVTTFYLVFTGNVTAKNAKQQGDFMAAMFEAAAEIQRLNEMNCILARKPTRRAPFNH